jgi:hypothetical protein
MKHLVILFGLTLTGLAVCASDGEGASEFTHEEREGPSRRAQPFPRHLETFQGTVKVA